MQAATGEALGLAYVDQGYTGETAAVICGALTLDLRAAIGRRILAKVAGRDVTLGVRPGAIRQSATPAAGTTPAAVYVTEPRGHNVIVDLRLGDAVIRALGDRDDERLADLAPNDRSCLD